jgi:hypothetical protein
LINYVSIEIGGEFGPGRRFGEDASGPDDARGGARSAGRRGRRRRDRVVGRGDAVVEVEPDALVLAAVIGAADRRSLRVDVAAVVFGYEELREKIVADGAGLSDLVLEAVKVNVLTSDRALLDDGVLTLRLERVLDGGDLLMLPEWPEGRRTEPAAPFVIARSVYDAMMTHHDRLAAERRDLASGPHCSLLRLIDWRARAAG